MKKRTLLMAGIASFLLASLSQLPARLLIDRLPTGLPVSIAGVGGTVWQGSASSVDWQQVQLRNVQWDLQLLSLFKGQLAAHVQAQSATGGNVQGICGVTFSGKRQCHDVKVADLPATALTPYLQRLMVPPLRGQFQADIATLVWDPAAFPQLNGRIEWQGAGIELAPQAFGNYTATLDAGNDGVQHANLQSAPDAAFSLDGQASVQADGTYQLAANLKPGAGVDANTKQFLSMKLGAPQTDGGYRLAQQGKL
jgi:general secretion pathway protein N